jgi:hypothetical protein
MRTIYQFTHPELGFPDRMIEASDGNLNGTAEGEYRTGYHGYSSIFRISPSTGRFETVFALKNGRYGGCPCHLIQGSDGKIYGASMNLGTYQGGTIFVLDAGLPPPKPQLGLIRPSTGAAGQTGVALGTQSAGNHGGFLQRNRGHEVRGTVQPGSVGGRAGGRYQRPRHRDDA